MIQGNIPSASSMRVQENIIGQQAAKRMGCRTVRIEAGLGSMDMGKMPVFPTAPIANVMGGLKDYNLSAQWMVNGAPHNSGPISNLPSQQYWPAVTAMVQGIVDQVHADFPGAVFEIANEPDGIAAPASNGIPIWQAQAKPKGWIPAQWFAYMMGVYSAVNWRGHKLCMHLVGGGQAPQKVTASCFKCSDGLRLISLIYDSGGFVAYNTYPNQTLAFLSSVSGFVGHYLGYTWPNTVAVHKASALSLLRIKIGETGVRQTLTLSGAKLQAMRQGLFDGIRKAGLDATCFAVLTTDPNSAAFSVCKLDGTAVIADLVLG